MDNIWKAAFADQKRDAQIVSMRDSLCVFTLRESEKLRVKLNKVENTEG